MHDWAKIRTMFRKKTIHCCVWPNIIGWRPSDQGVRNFYIPAGNNHHFENEFIVKTFARWKNRRTLDIAPSCCSRSATTSSGGVRRHPALLVPERGFREPESRR